MMFDILFIQVKNIFIVESNTYRNKGHDVNKLKKILADSPAIKRSAYFHAYLRNSSSSLWRVNCGSVSRGCAVGLFAAVIPIIPFQMVLAVILAILIRGNLAVSILVSWVSNPFTYIPIAYIAYRVGELTLGGQGSTHLYQLGKTYFVGVGIVSIGLAIAGFLITVVIWHGYVYIKQHFHK